MLAAALMIFSWLPVGNVGETPGLEKSVREYWSLLQGGWRVQAIQFVLPDCRGNFERRIEPPFRNWRLVDMTSLPDNQAKVVVVVERYIQGGLYDQTITETWKKDGGEWKVRIEDPVETRKALWKGSEPRPRKDRLEVRPVAMKIHLLDGNREDSVVIFNGLASRVKIAGFEFDAERFEWANPMTEVESGQLGKVTLRYKGVETALDLKSEAVLVLRNESKETRIVVPITYNYVSPGARSLLGLSEAAAAPGSEASSRPRHLAPH